MKRLLTLLIFVTLGLSFQGCKKFLNLDPIDDLSGNNYWKTKSDVDRFTWNIYARFKEKTMGSAGQAVFFFPAVGDFRMAPISSSTAYVNRYQYFIPLRTNNIRNLLNPSYNNVYLSFYNLINVTRWNEFYDMISMSNILIDNVDKLESGILSPSEVSQYKAEAVFLRSLAYFFIVRLFGDAPYYTNPYNSEPLPRTDMLVILDNCLADLDARYKDLPWTYTDNSLVGTKAMRGSAIALMMHINMWAASFEKVSTKKTQYYERTDALGKELMEENNGAYRLFPMEEYTTVFKGKSKESLFEISQSLNYGERFSGNALYSNQVLRAPFKPDVTTSFCYYDRQFLDKLYPEGAPDKRRDLWFDANIYSTNGQFQFKKFINFYSNVDYGGNPSPDDSQIIFRYSDAILLRAEALSEMNNDGEARTYLNMIRDRAGAEVVEVGGEELKYAIFLERCRELMGEGHYYFDLVRTRRILDRDFIPNAISIEDFEQGAWTWPIHSDAKRQNPFMVLNNYWL